MCVALLPVLLVGGGALVQEPEPVPAVAVTRELELIAGELAIDRESATLQVLKGRRLREACPLGEVLLLETDRGELLHVASEAGLAKGVARLVEHELASGYAELARESLKSRDADLMEQLVAKARAHGSKDEDLERIVSRSASVRRANRRPDDEVVAALRAAEVALDSRFVDGYWERALALRPRATGAAWLGLLQAQLERAPGHVQATRAVRERIVEDLYGGTQAGRASLEALLSPSGGSFDALAWIACLRLAADFPIRILTPPDGDRAGIDPDERRLGQLSLSWRPDLVCLRTANLRVMTPLVEPLSVARCLQTGELVSRTLQHYLGGGRPEREVPTPLTLHLYQDRDEYRAESASPGSDEPGGKEWSAGHYDSRQNVQHVYLPRDEEAFTRVLGVYAHELTHNWMQMKCPLFTLEEVNRVHADVAGYWVVEGVAELVESFRFEPGAALGEPTLEQVDGLDIVAGADPGDLLPWEDVYTSNHEAFEAHSSEADREVPISWRPGWRRKLSEISMFYAQAGATAQYLFHAEDGRWRQQLLDYAAARYTGRVEALGVVAAFGCSAEELGARVVAFARRNRDR